MRREVEAMSADLQALCDCDHEALVLCITACREAARRAGVKFDNEMHFIVTLRHLPERDFLDLVEQARLILLENTADEDVSEVMH